MDAFKLSFPAALRTLALVLVLSACGAAQRALAAEVSVHDPAMAQEGKNFYVFSTGPGITMYSSANLHDWRAEGPVFDPAPAWARNAAPTFNGHMWAPDVQFHQGKYLLYYSVSGFGSNASAIGVASNVTLNPRAAAYHWQDQGQLLQSVPGRDNWNAIDPNVVEDEQGQGWMVFGSFWSGIKLVRLNPDWTRLAQPQEWHALAQRERPAFTPDSAAGPAEIEAPFIFKKNNYYYLFVSWGLC